MMVNRAVAVGLLGIVVVTAHPRAQRTAEGGMTVRILSPADDSYVSGPTVVRAQVDPPNAAVGVSFYVDGRQICRVTTAPYECDWDAGPAIAKHQIRVVATTSSGPAGRATATIITKGVAFAESVDVELVQVTATITDGKGKYVSGLPQSAFRVFEDGRAQRITHFAADNVSLDLVLAVDVSSSMKDAMPKVKVAVKEFLSEIAPTDQVTVLGFNDTIFPLTRKSTDPAARLKAVDRLAPWGATALYDVIISGVDILGRGTGRKAMLVFSDGEDQGSHSSLSDVERRLEASDVSLYMIGMGRGVKMETLKKTMSRLASATGGRLIATEKVDDLHAAFAELLDELSHQYLLGYTSTNPNHDGTLRRLKVEVDGRHQIRAREAYRAPEKK
jgi:Ca-activated chloride channel family protein